MKRKILIKESNYYSGMKAKNCKTIRTCHRGQVAIEHLTVTAAILAMVTIAFAFGFVTFDQNMKIAKARDALTALVGTANEVYTLGKGNVRFVDVSFPAGMTKIEIKHACCRGWPNCATKEIVVNEDDCPEPNNKIEFSLIEITVSLLGGDTAISRESKAKLVLSDLPPVDQAAGGPPYTFRAAWTQYGGKIELQRV